MDLQEPGPSPESLNTILDSALRVPDHGKLGPWRLVIFQHDDRAAFGDILAARWRVLHPDANEAQLRFEQNRFMRAPVVIAVISERPAHGIRVDEHVLDLRGPAHAEDGHAHRAALILERVAAASLGKEREGRLALERGR